MDITATLQDKRNIDTELIIQELTSCEIDYDIDAHTIKQVGLQSIKDNFDPELSCGRVNDLLYKEEEFVYPIFDIPYTNSLIKELLPDFKYTPFEQGIKETINWFKENYKNARK